MAGMEPTTHYTSYSDLSRNDLNQFLTLMIDDPTYHWAYTDNHPDTVQEHLLLFQNGTLLHPHATLNHGHLVGVHWLHDVCITKANAAWVGGYVAESARGHKHEGMRKDDWTHAQEYFERKGYPILFCAAGVHNTRADIWIQKQCRFTKVGIVSDWLVWDGEYKDTTIYTWRPEDAALCREEAEILKTRSYVC